MALPTDLLNDFTNSADEIPDTDYVVENDPTFDEDPLTTISSTTSPSKKGDSLIWISVIIIVIGFILIGLGLNMNSELSTSLHPMLVIGFLLLFVGVILFFYSVTLI
jgi:uncharacterized membrane protein